MTQEHESKNPIRSTREILAGILLVLLLALLIVINWGPLALKTIAFTVSEAPYHTLGEILSHPQTLIPHTYTVSTMQKTLSGSMEGIYVEGFLGKGSLEPNMYIAAQLNAGNIEIQGAYLAHLHFDHTAGILELLKDIPDIAGKGEFHANFTFSMHGDHLAGIEALHQFDAAVRPGTTLSDGDQAQLAVERIIAFKQKYPEGNIDSEHDWPEP